MPFSEFENVTYKFSSISGLLRHRSRRADLRDRVRLRNLRQVADRAHDHRQGELRPQARQDRQVSFETKEIQNKEN